MSKPKVGDKAYRRMVTGVLKLHVVAIVDGDQVVYKYYSKRVCRWIYQVESSYIFCGVNLDAVQRRDAGVRP